MPDDRYLGRVFGAYRVDALLGQGTGAIGAGTIAQLRFAHVVVATDTTTSLSLDLQELIDQRTEDVVLYDRQ